MGDYNRVILAGRLTRDPTLRYTESQTPVADFGLAINRKWTGLDGTMRSDVCFVDCRAFGPQAEAMFRYLKKGKPILLEGRLHFEKWEKDGRKQSKLRVTVEAFQFQGRGARAAPPRYDKKGRKVKRKVKVAVPLGPAREAEAGSDLLVDGSGWTEPAREDGESYTGF